MDQRVTRSQISKSKHLKQFQLNIDICYRHYNQIIQYHQATFFRMDATLHQQTGQPSLQNPAQTVGVKVEKKQEQEIDFISQFLELPRSQSPSPLLSHSHNQQKKQISILTSETFERQNSSIQNSQPKLKSIFHNFQKHLVVTLRNNIRMRAIHRRDRVLHLSTQMWNFFLQSNITSKKVLHFLFGAVHLTPEQNYLQARNNILPGTEQMLTDHTPEQLVAAQEHLRAEVIKQGYRIIQRNGLSQRRMQKSDEFQSYLISFLEELQNGPLNRRLPKREKMEIIKEIQKIREDIV